MIKIVKKDELIRQHSTSPTSHNHVDGAGDVGAGAGPDALSCLNVG